MADFQTPPVICAYMVSLVPANATLILEPTSGQGNLVRALRSDLNRNITAPPDIWAVNPDVARFDCVVMNPPFTPMQIGYTILYRCLDMAPVVIALMPWLTFINSERRTARLVQFGLKSVTHLPRKVFPGSRVQTCIFELVSGFKKDTTLKVWDGDLC